MGSHGWHFSTGYHNDAGVKEKTEKICKKLPVGRKPEEGDGQLGHSHSKLPNGVPSVLHCPRHSAIIKEWERACKIVTILSE
jgi:hypothetical protein